MSENTANTQKKMQSPLLKRKLFLYLTEFFSGMSVMAVELGASRLLAPYFSSSQIVWTIIIGTIMIAMALGNYYGGRSADKDPDPDRLYKRILVAAVWIAAIPFIGKLVILGVSALLIVTISTGFLIWAAFLACMIIFVYPLFLLGTVTPSLVKYTTQSLEDNGSTVGTLGAYNTIGSIIGTFAPTFITIPAVGTSVTFLIFSGVLLGLGLVYFISCKRGTVRLAVCGVLFVLCCVLSTRFGFAFWETKLVYEGESIYNYLQVNEDDEKLALSTNVLFGVQSVYMKNDSLSGLYYDTAMAAPLMSEGGEESSLLVLGMGTGTYAKQCLHYYPAMTAEGVEIDEKITSLAHTYFELDKDIKVVTYDGRAYLEGLDRAYKRGEAERDRFDVIMVDAYQDITIPFQMSTEEFFRLVYDHLKPGGVMVVNMNMQSRSEDSINYYLADTISSVFESVCTSDVPWSTNRELFAFKDAEALGRFEGRIDGLEDPDLRDCMERVYGSLKGYEPGDRLLTDDKAPVELLGMRVIDELISKELEHYKKVFKEEGIKGLLEG